MKNAPAKSDFLENLNCKNLKQSSFSSDVQLLPEMHMVDNRVMIYKIFFQLMCVFFAISLSAYCKGKESEKTIGVVNFIKGNPFLERNSQKSELKKGDKVQEGDVISTDDKSLVILIFNNEVGELEIQAKTILSVDSFLSNKKSIQVKQGSVWTKITKLAKNDEFQLHTPTSVAGVRGTKFYTFQIGEYQGTCHCEGNIQLELKGQKYNEVNKEDILVVSKGGKSIVITPSEFKVKRPADERHEHSQIDNSPLGKRKDLSKAEFDAFIETIEEKFQALK